MKRNRRQEMIDAQGLFSAESFLGIDLAEEFTKARLALDNGIVSLGKTLEAKSFGRNAGAIEATGGKIKPDEIFKTHGFNTHEFGRAFTAKAHTERNLALDFINWLIPEGNKDPDVPKRPDEEIKVSIDTSDKKGRDKKKRMELTELSKNAAGFGSFLTANQSVVKEFSERVPCVGKEGCDVFNNNFLPNTEDTAVGFFTEKTNVQGAKKEVENFTNQLKNVYEHYLKNSSAKAQKPRDLPKPFFPITSLDDSIVKVFDVKNSGLESVDSILSKLAEEARNIPLPDSSPFSSPSLGSLENSPEKFLVEVAPGVFSTRTMDSPLRSYIPELNDLSSLDVTPKYNHKKGEFKSVSIPFSFDKVKYKVPPVDTNGDDNFTSQKSAERVIDQTHHKLHNHDAHHGHDHQSSTDN